MNRTTSKRSRRASSAALTVLWLAAGAVATGLAPDAIPAASTNQPPPPPDWLTKPMALVDAVNIALQQNANILKAKQDLEATHGVVVQTRAAAMPKVRGAAGYTHDELVEVPNFPDSESIFPPVEDRWSGNIQVTQSIYEGGRIRSALRSARFMQDQAVLQYQAVVADTLLEVRVAYYNVLMAEKEIDVQRASTNLLTQQLEDTTRRFEVGTVPRFNVLRAEVELANARPRLLRVENAYRITKNNLANVLGYDVPSTVWEDIPLQLTGKLEAEPYDIQLPDALARAVQQRPELGALRLAEKLRKEDIVRAKSTYKPTVELFGGYAARNSNFTDDFWEAVAGANAGVHFTWEIWDGNQTKGRVLQAKALHEKSQVEMADTTRRIELEVRTAYSSFLEAKQVLDSQKKVLEQADEALRLAQARYEAGTGTQLDVLDAQTALTDARTTHVRALREHVVALARLRRAVGWDAPQAPAPDKTQKPGGKGPE